MLLCLVIFVFLVEMGFHCVAHTDLELLTLSDPPASASQNAGITGMSHHAWPEGVIKAVLLESLSCNGEQGKLKEKGPEAVILSSHKMATTQTRMLSVRMEGRRQMRKINDLAGCAGSCL